MVGISYWLTNFFHIIGSPNVKLRNPLISPFKKIIIQHFQPRISMISQGKLLKNIMYFAFSFCQELTLVNRNLWLKNIYLIIAILFLWKFDISAWNGNVNNLFQNWNGHFNRRGFRDANLVLAAAEDGDGRVQTCRRSPAGETNLLSS